MKKKVINRKVCVISQPKRTILSILVIDEDMVKFPILPKIHNDIPKIEEYSDVFFLFSGNFEKIDPEKFTSLYGGCGYLVDDAKDINSSLFQVLQYGKEIFETHLTYTIWKFDEISRVNNMSRLCENLQKFNMSDLKWPVFKIRRLGPSELCDIYMRSDGEKEERVKNFLELLYKIWYKDDKGNGINKHSTYTSNSVCLIFKRDSILKLLEAWNEEKEWIDTFTWADYRYLFASLSKHLSIQVQDNDIETLEL